MPRVDWLLIEESGQPRVVKLCKLAEVPPFMGHDPRVDVLKYSLTVRHARDPFPAYPIDLLQVLLNKSPVVLPLVQLWVRDSQKLVDGLPVELDPSASDYCPEINTSDFTFCIRSANPTNSCIFPGVLSSHSPDQSRSLDQHRSRCSDRDFCVQTLERWTRGAQ